jgi:putative transposase
VLQLQRSVYYYRHRRDPQTELRVRLKDLAAARVRYGYERLHTLLRREGWQINHKRVYRLYHEEG